VASSKVVGEDDKSPRPRAPSGVPGRVRRPRSPPPAESPPRFASRLESDLAADAAHGLRALHAKGGDAGPTTEPGIPLRELGVRATEPAPERLRGPRGPSQAGRPAPPPLDEDAEQLAPIDIFAPGHALDPMADEPTQAPAPSPARHLLDPEAFAHEPTHPKPEG
jgi:hypothetical protein